MNLYERIKPIRSDEDYKEALALIDELIDAKPGSDAYRVLDIVSELVYAYEERNIEIPLPTSRLNKPSQRLEIPKGVLTIGELVGSWPGTETDEEIAEVLALLRG
jgi:antitoxin component HigA of HigAB toxin-antitoxin module